MTGEDRSELLLWACTKQAPMFHTNSDNIGIMTYYSRSSSTKSVVDVLVMYRSDLRSHKSVKIIVRLFSCLAISTITVPLKTVVKTQHVQS